MRPTASQLRLEGGLGLAPGTGRAVVGPLGLYLGRSLGCSRALDHPAWGAAARQPWWPLQRAKQYLFFKPVRIPGTFGPRELSNLFGKWVHRASQISSGRPKK